MTKSMTQMKVAGYLSGVGYTLYGEAHWLLAFTYFKLAKNYPRSIAGATGEVSSYTKTLWTGVVCNTVFPVLQTVFSVLFVFSKLSNRTY